MVERATRRGGNDDEEGQGRGAGFINAEGLVAFSGRRQTDEVTRGGEGEAGPRLAILI